MAFVRASTIIHTLFFSEGRRYSGAHKLVFQCDFERDSCFYRVQPESTARNAKLKFFMMTKYESRFNRGLETPNKYYGPPKNDGMRGTRKFFSSFLISYHHLELRSPVV